MKINMLLIFLSLVLFTLLLEKTCKKSYIILYPIYVYLILNLKPDNFNVFYLLNVIFGFYIAPFLSFATFYLTNRVKLSLLRPKILWTHLSQIIFEEAIFRWFFLNMIADILSDYLNSNMTIIFASIVSAIFFTAWHSYTNINDFVEMTIFSIVLGVTAYYLPLMNIGIHLGRNSYINDIKELSGNEV